MKKIITLICMFIVTICTLTGCKGNAHLGIYKSTEFKLNGVDYSSTIVTLELREDDEFTFTQIKESNNSILSVLDGEYELKGKDITLTSLEIDGEDISDENETLKGKLKGDTITLEDEATDTKIVLKKVNLKGKYHCTKITYNGSNILSQYEYYYINLKDDEKCVVAAAGKENGMATTANATYEIKRNKIYIYSKTNGIKVTEIYDFINGVIYMDQPSYGIYAEFQKR